MADTEPIDALREIVDLRGLEWVFQQPEMVEGMLVGALGSRSPQLHLLVASPKAGIPQRSTPSASRNWSSRATGERLKASAGDMPLPGRTHTAR